MTNLWQTCTLVMTNLWQACCKLKLLSGTSVDPLGTTLELLPQCELGSCGPIGQQLTCYEKLPVVDYEPIDCLIPDIDRNLLRKDQQYLLDISNAITLGHCPEDLAYRDPRPLSHSRWLTAVNRVLRLYTSSSDPSGNLKEIVGFILKSCMPVWPAIKKSKNLLTDQNMSFKQSKHHGIYPTNYLVVSSNATECVLCAPRECSVGNACR
ncbi:hypothetical protein AVEN_181837-1 [Araneus ventricosus]|uniref:Uncharacterized protein n=1 Tax=Araneus ventricosus TaxID=182803 RepID=A0A4Y2EWE3_ARAVE|nr:hypothetical protein AVEN_181837-1 [Araneus ventricosus]